MGCGLIQPLRWRFCVAVLAFGVSACTPGAADVEPDQASAPVTAATQPVPSSPATAAPQSTTVGSPVPSTAVPTVPTAPQPTLPPTTPAPTTTLPPDCIGLAEMTPGERLYIGADGQERTFHLAVPPGYDGTRAAGLILNFHEHSSSGALHEQYTAMAEMATPSGYIVVSPNSTLDPPSWNTRSDGLRLDDFAFAHGLVAALQTTMCIDAARIYAAGHANGGVFAASLVCSAPHEFAAVAIVAAVPVPSCPAEVQPAVIQVLGTADELTMYDGNVSRASAHESIRSWAQHAGCVEPPYVVPVVDGVERLQFDGCAGADVVLFSVIGGAHPWPGGSVAKNRVGNSESGRTFPATKTILSFFDSHIRAA